MSDNRYGLNKDLFRKNLEMLARDVDNYRPDEMCRALESLAETTGESQLSQCQAVLEQKVRYIHAQVDEMDELKKELEKARGACKDFYLSYHVSQMAEKLEVERLIWSLGQDVYIGIINKE